VGTHLDLAKVTDKCEEAAALLKVLSHPGRLKLLCHLLSGEKTVSEIEVLTGLSQSYASQFLSKMRLEGLVNFRKEGVQTYYRITDGRVNALMGSLYEIFCKEDVL
jgi:ArsR family transcriptional regulator